MKTVLSLILTVLLASQLIANSTSPNKLFELDKNIYSQFDELDKLESIIIQKHLLPIKNLIDINNILSKKTNYNKSKQAKSLKLYYDDISPFLLGCCLGPIGIGILLVSAEDTEAVYKSVCGCLIPSALMGIGIYTGDPFIMWTAVEIFLEVWE